MGGYLLECCVPFPQDQVKQWKEGYKDPEGLVLARQVDMARRDKAVRQYAATTNVCPL